MEILSLKFAKKAMELVKNVPENEKEDYLKAVRRLGSMITQNGVLGTMVFLKQKNKDTLLKHLEIMVGEMIGVNDFSLETLKDMDFGKYLRVQVAALESSKWLKRYAEILLGGDEE